MEKNKNTMGLLLPTTGCGGGATVFSCCSATGSMSSVSKEDDNNNNIGGGGGLFSSEVSSLYESNELELGLGLSLGGFISSSSSNYNHNNNKSNNPGVGSGPWGQYARILTAKDFPCLVSKSGSNSSSNSVVTSKNHSININNSAVATGTKRSAADSVSPPNVGATSQVVGWPPIRTYRMNSLVNQAKLGLNEEFCSIVKEQKGKNVGANKASNSCNKHNNDGKEKGLIKTSLFVKVNMDGILIGRKVDLNAQGCYDTLAQTLEEMFYTRNTTISTGRSSMEEHRVMAEAVGPSKLLDGSSEFVLTYEDKEGDWMLVGDVPWRMFLNSVKRLRIMRTSEANGLAPKSQESSARQRT